MSIDKSDLQTLVGAAVIGTDGDKIGEVSQFYLSDTTGEPSWATVKTGLFGGQDSFVPLDGASNHSGELRVAFDKAMVKDAPRVDSDGHLTPEEEDELYRYYGHGDDERGIGGDESDRSRPDTADADDRRLADDPDDSRLGRDDDAGRGDDATAGVVGPAGGGLGRQRVGDGDDEDRDREHERDLEGSRPGDRARAHDGADDADDDTADLGAVSPGETRTRMRRYVVTEHVTQTVEELPDDEGPAGPARGV